MQVVTLGAGAIGGYFANVLARAGHDVAVLSRGRTLDAIRAEGLRIVGGPDEGAARVDAVDTLDGIDPELVIVATKTYDTEAVLQVLAPVATEETVVLPLQNGVNRASVISAMVPRATVLGGTVFMESKVTAPGQVTYVGGPRRIVMGGYDDAARGRAEKVGAELRNAGVNAEVYEDVQVELWKKFVMVCAGNALSSLTRSTLGALLGDEAGRALVVQNMTESVTLAHRLGVGLPDGFVQAGVDYLVGMGQNARSSMLADIEAGRLTEVDALNGYVVDRSDRLGLDAPLHRLISVALRLHNQRVAAA